MTETSSRAAAECVSLLSVCSFHYQQLLPKLTVCVHVQVCVCACADVCVCVSADVANMSHLIEVSQKTRANIPRNGVVRFPTKMCRDCVSEDEGSR